MPFNIGGYVYNGGIADPQDYLSIVTRGITLHFDASAPSSYPGSGTTWSDISVNTNNGTLTNGPTFNSSNGGSIVLDGTDDYIEVANNSTLNSSTCTVDIWFKYTTANNYYAMVVGKTDSFGSYNGWNIYVYNNVVYAQIKAGVGTQVDFTGISITTTPWYNVVLSVTSGGTGTFYVNGSSADSKSVISYTVSTQPLRIARSVDTFWTNFGGNVASLKLYNRALAAAEVLQNFNVQRSRFGI